MVIQKISYMSVEYRYICIYICMYDMITSKEIFYQVQTREMFVKQLVFPDQTAEQHTSQYYQRGRGQDSF